MFKPFSISASINRPAPPMTGIAKRKENRYWDTPGTGRLAGTDLTEAGEDALDHRLFAGEIGGPMKIASTLVLVILILLSIFSGATKIALMPEDVEFFGEHSLHNFQRRRVGHEASQHVRCHLKATTRISGRGSRLGGLAHLALH